MAEFILGLVFLAAVIFAEECRRTPHTRATWD